jgi:hypothetical protein
MNPEPAAIQGLRADLLDTHRALAGLRERNTELADANRELAAQLASATQTAGELLRALVAFRRLHEASDAEAALHGLAEILATIVGTEDFAVVAIESPELCVVAGMGPAMERAQLAPTLHALAANAVRVVPLLLGSYVVGVIVIDTLLPHRSDLSAADEQILELLSSFAATAIVAADERPQWTGLPFAEAS